jgi:hypothetical protein
MENSPQDYVIRLSQLVHLASCDPCVTRAGWLRLGDVPTPLRFNRQSGSAQARLRVQRIKDD